MIKSSNDSKTRARAGQANTFGLLPGPQGSCPGATTGCGGCWAPLKVGNKTACCYVDRLMRARPNVKNILQQNTDFMKSASEAEMVEALVAEFTRFNAAEDKAGSTVRNYRLHWSGDIFSKAYARALTTAMSKFPGIHFWAYTRSWELLDAGSLDLKNLRLWLSLDVCNVDAGLAWLKKHNPKRTTKIGLSFMGNTLPSSLDKYVEAEGLKPFPCPVDDSGKMKLEGACQRCAACLRENNKLIQFKI